MIALFKQAMNILLDILNEITDQNAYRRYLISEGVPHSGAAWRRFCDRRWQDKERRGRCC
jgi:hypothetical protein